MIIYFCGISGIIEAFTINVQILQSMNWTRFRLETLLDLAKLVTMTECLSCQGAQMRMNMKSISHRRKALTILNLVGQDATETFDKYGDFGEEAKVSLSNLNFLQIDKDIIKCQTCDCAQR